jgi:hypothetical protein
VVPILGNVTIKYPLSGSNTMDVNIPFAMNNSNAEVSQADSSNPNYVNPADSSSAPGDFK